MNHHFRVLSRRVAALVVLLIAAQPVTHAADKQRKAKASADARWSQTGRNANASPDAMRTHCEGNAPSLQTPDTKQEKEKETPRTADPTAAARVCFALRRTGLAALNPGHPDLLALIAAGATEAEFVGAAQGAVDRGKGFAYALGTLKRQRLEAAQTAAQMHAGTMPAKSATDRQVATMNALTGKDQHHGQRPQFPDTIDISARVVT